MKSFTPEMIEKAKAANSAEQILEIAKANNIEMTSDEASTYFAQLNPKSGEISDDDLDSVAGGCGNRDERLSVRDIVRVTSGQTCDKCGSNIGRVDMTGAYGFQWGVCCTNCKNSIFVGDLNYATVEVIEHR